LRGANPPLSESEITRERLALEEAVRKVEEEAAGRARARAWARRIPGTSPPVDPPETIELLNIDGLIDHTAVAQLWDRYIRGENKVFTRRLYTPAGLKAFDEVARKYRADSNFKQTVDRYIDEYERLLEEILRGEDGQQKLRNHLISETGKVYTMLGHAAGRFGGGESADSLEERVPREREPVANQQREEELRLQREEEARRQREEEASWPREEEGRRQHEEIWRQREEAMRQREEEKFRLDVIRHKLAEMASPAPSLSPDGRLDAGRNLLYDAPSGDNDLPTLPIRQRGLIKAIISGLPRNAPRQLAACLKNYDDELKARGVQPILGLLKDMAAIIDADVGAIDASREWLEDGLREAFKRFIDNHALFVTHFPLDPEREELYASTPIDEIGATGDALSRPFEAVAEATLHANRAGFTTDDFLSIVDKLTEFAKVTSTLPLSDPRHEPSLKAGFEDRMDAPQVSPRKRALLSGFGFFERAYNLLGSTATLIGTPEGIALLAALGEALASLSKLIGFG
jgi:hypothetical protein